MRAHPGRRGIVVALLVAAVVVVTASSGLAKGPSQAVIKGPGLSSPITLLPPGQPTIGSALATMVEESGFLDFAAPDSLPDRRLPGTLGPRYTPVDYLLLVRCSSWATLWVEMTVEDGRILLR
jgi:hypothetical protein